VPNASEAAAAPLLATTGDVPTYNILVGGTAVPTRPIKLGAQVGDIIGLSSHPGIIKNGVFDAWDQLDKVMNIGEIFFRVTAKNGATTKTAIFKNDISMQQNALLTQKPQGLAQEYQTSCLAHLILKADSVPVSGHSISEIKAVIEGIFGTTGGVQNTIIANTRLSAEANIDSGSFVVNANNTTLKEVINDATGSLNLGVIDGTTLALTIEPLYYMPALRRTNSNLRDYGLLIDANTNSKWRYPVTYQSPLTTKTPVGGMASVNIETLLNIANIMIKGQCYNVLKNTAAIIKENNGIPAYAPMPGARLVTPTFIESTLRVSDLTLTLNSIDSIPNLKGALNAALNVAIGELIQRSNYIAGLLSLGLPADDYEVILLTDPRLSGLLMIDGDMRTFGNNRAFQTAVDPMVDLKNKIWFSLRRKDRQGNQMHALDFGTRLTAPAIPIEINMPRNGAMVTETQIMVRANAYSLCPVLGLLTVEDLDTIFTQ
jgi:hypothetical protein